MAGIYNDFQAQQAPLSEGNYSGGVGRSLADDEEARRQQAAYAEALRIQAQGGGPSLAQDALKNNVQAINAQARSAIGSARGVSPGLQSQMILQQQAAANQNAAGQAATLRLQEQMRAREMQGAALGTMRGQDQGLLGTAGGLQNSQNANRISNQMQANQINAGIAAQNTDTNKAIVGNLAGAAGKGLALLAHGGMVEPMGYADGGDVAIRAPFNMDDGPMRMAPHMMAVDQVPPSPVPAVVAPASAPATAQDPSFWQRFATALRSQPQAQQPGAAPATKPTRTQVFGDMLSTLGSGLGGQHMADGGPVVRRLQPNTANWTQEEKDRLYRQNIEETNRLTRERAAAEARQADEETYKDDGFRSRHGRDPIKVGGLRFADGGQAEGAEQDAPRYAAALAAAHTPVNNPAHDVVPAMLSPGEVVLPREVVNGPHPEDRAAAFVAALKAHEEQKKRSATPSSYGEIVRLERELAAMKSRLGGAK